MLKHTSVGSSTPQVRTGSGMRKFNTDMRIQSLKKGFLTVHQIEAVRRTITSRLKRKGKI